MLCGQHCQNPTTVRNLLVTNDVFRRQLCVASTFSWQCQPRGRHLHETWMYASLNLAILSYFFMFVTVTIFISPTALCLGSLQDSLFTHEECISAGAALIKSSRAYRRCLQLRTNMQLCLFCCQSKMTCHLRCHLRSAMLRHAPSLARVIWSTPCASFFIF